MIRRLVTAGIVLLLASAVGGQENGDLFADVFGSQSAAETDADLFFFQEPLSIVPIRLEQGVVLVDAVAFIDPLEDHLKPETIESLRSIPLSDGYFDITSLPRFGIHAEYDSTRLRITVELDSEVMTELGLSISSDRPVQNLVQPPFFSGYVNSRLATTVQDGVTVATVALEPVLNMGGWVLESDIVTGNTIETTVQGAKLVHDWRPAQLRVSAGLVETEQPNFLRIQRFFGVLAERTGRLDRTRPFQPTGEINFSVTERQSTQILVNGRLYKTFDVAPGVYSIDRIPLKDGQNDIRVISTATDEELVYNRYFYDARLVAPGRHFFSYGVGFFPGENQPLNAEWDDPLITLQHQYGFTSNVTGGLLVQSNLDRLLFSGSAVAATGFGSSAVQAAFSVPWDGDRPAWFTGVGHSVPVVLDQGTVYLQIDGSFRQQGFYRPIPDYQDPDDSQEIEIEISFSNDIGRRGTLRTGFGWIRNEGNTFVIPVNANIALGEGQTLRFALTPTIAGGAVTWRGAIYLRLSAGGTESSVTVNNDLRSGATVQILPPSQLGVQRYSWGLGMSGFDWSESASRSVQGRLLYQGFRFRSGLNGAFSTYADGQYTLAAHGESALAFAGNAVVLSRPINDGFAIYRAGDILSGYDFGIQPGYSGMRGMVTNGKGVYPEIRSFRARSVVVDTTKLPDGLSVSNTRVTVDPGYRQGYLVELNAIASVYLTGILTDADGTPLGLQVGEIVDSSGASRMFFTARDGYFEIHGVTPGEYRLFLYDYPDSESLFAVPEDAQGRFDLEDVVFFTGEEAFLEDGE